MTTDGWSLVPKPITGGRWILTAAAVFACGGFLAALVGTAVLSGLGLAFGRGLTAVPAVTVEVVGAVVLWFGAPTLGAVVTATPLWAVLVELGGREFVATTPERSRLAYPALGGVVGLMSGLAAHVVMWVIIAVVVSLYQTPISVSIVGEIVGAIYMGLYLGLLSIAFTGVISGPILAVTGVGLGVAKHRITTNDVDSGAIDAEWDRMETATDGAS